MKKKGIATPILLLFLACTIVLYFSSCTLFRDSNKSNYVVTGQGVAKFIGSIRACQGNAESHYGLGRYLQERKKHKPAIEEFRAALEIDPNHVEAYNGLGVSYDAIRDHDRAVESYKAALKICDKLDYVLNNLGYSYLLQGRTDLAIENFKKALELNGGNARYRNNLGLAYAKTGQYDAALAEFKEADGEAKAHYNIAQLYYQEGLYKEAEAHFERASLLKASDPQIERGLKTAGILAGIVTKSERAPEGVGDTTVHAAQQETNTYDDEGGFYVIPAGALEKIKSREIVEVDRIEKRDAPSTQRVVKPVFSPAFARIKVREGVREEVARILEAEPLKLYDEVQALELVTQRTADIEKEPIPRIKMEVSNGNGVRYMARNVGNYLKGNGFILMYLSNARSFSHEETKIYYTKGYLREACLIAQKLPGRQSLEEVAEIREGNAEISILIGKDLIPHLDLFKKG
jgi:Flp pilus assembly protein TadD